MIFYFTTCGETVHSNSLQVLLSRYAEEVVGIFRFIVLYAVGVSTFILTLCGIILLMVSETYVFRI